MIWTEATKPNRRTHWITSADYVPRHPWVSSDACFYENEHVPLAFISRRPLTKTFVACENPLCSIADQNDLAGSKLLLADHQQITLSWASCALPWALWTSSEAAQAPTDASYDAVQCFRLGQKQLKPSLIQIASVLCQPPCILAAALIVSSGIRFCSISPWQMLPHSL